MSATVNLLGLGQRVGIRFFSRSDVDDWATWPDHHDALFRDYNSPDLSPRDRDLWFAERLARPDHAMYAIVNLDGELIGRLFLRQVDKTRLSAVLGVDLRSDMLDAGYGTDALRCFNTYYFATLGYKVLKLDVAGYNCRAQRVYEKLGWVHTGEHWNTYPSIFAPEVFTDPQYEPVRKYFRSGQDTVSVLHYDMMLCRERWQEVSQHEG